MYQLRCTKKSQDLLGFKAHDLSEVESESHVLGNWYMHTFTQERRKCLFFMEEKTLMSFILVGFRKSESKYFDEAFKGGLLNLLALENAPNEVITSFENAPAAIRFTKTDSRKLVGHMNEKMSLFQDFVYADGGFERCDLAEITAKINRMPQRQLGWALSVEALNDLFN
ncbi:hypothetical protein F0231_20460 [Vibrio sp. RE86]|uniref:DUF6933 domain-containing protein n=1 Tax=Vibrio sp. RE86 TaxID=2607605 RepID=UPI001493404B|nr:hypothetical protein [Vibrio sp. RE86]NOH82091.1 hypothetical protein [Vibrio sp. RE86]